MEPMASRCLIEPRLIDGPGQHAVERVAAACDSCSKALGYRPWPGGVGDYGARDLRAPIGRPRLLIKLCLLFFHGTTCEEQSHWRGKFYCATGGISWSPKGLYVRCPGEPGRKKPCRSSNC